MLSYSNDWKYTGENLYVRRLLLSSEYAGSARIRIEESTP